MIKLTITSLVGTVTVQDPRPTTQTGTEPSVISVTAGTPQSLEIQWGQLERIAPQLQALATAGLCTFAVANSTTNAFANQPDVPSAPIIDLVAGAVSAATGVTGGVITGTNLLGGQTRAALTINSTATAAGHVVITALPVGFAGNLIDFRVIDSGSSHLAVTSATSSGRTIVTANLGGDTPTCAQMVTAINSGATGIVRSAATGTTSATITAAVALAPLVGGLGSGTSLTVGGVAAVIAAIDETTPAAQTITYNVGAVGASGNIASVHLRSNEKVATSVVVLTA
jgi:hypothetical protein